MLNFHYLKQLKYQKLLNLHQFFHSTATWIDCFEDVICVTNCGSTYTSKATLQKSSVYLRCFKIQTPSPALRSIHLVCLFQSALIIQPEIAVAAVYHR